MREKQMVSCFNAVAKAAKHLHSQHGEVSARKLVASELRKARRARSRKRFIFWESVAAQLAEQVETIRCGRREKPVESRPWSEVFVPGSPGPVTVSSSPWA
jgi:hypothetical protein